MYSPPCYTKFIVILKKFPNRARESVETLVAKSCHTASQDCRTFRGWSDMQWEAAWQLSWMIGSRIFSLSRWCSSGRCKEGKREGLKSRTIIRIFILPRDVPRKEERKDIKAEFLSSSSSFPATFQRTPATWRKNPAFIHPPKLNLRTIVKHQGNPTTRWLSR